MTARRYWTIVAALGAVATAATALSVLPQQTGHADLLTDANIRIDGAAAGDLSATSIAGIGDTNGDGRPDFAIGVSQADNNGRTDSGSTYVIFGQAAPTNIDLANLGARGYRIDGAATNDRSGGSVSEIGDANGDGRPDFAIGAIGAANNARAASGSTYVIFGQATPTNVDLVALGNRGYRIDGAVANDSSGGSVAGIGDTNGDGRADLAIGALSASNNGRSGSGSTYVVFGQAAPTNLDLVALGTRGYRIDGAAANDSSGRVAGIGDTNGDGRPDLAVGALGASNNGRAASGSTYVIFGQTTATDLDLAALGTRGYRIDGAASGNFSGNAVAGIGDTNGDGRPDLAIGAPAANNSRTSSGSTYVIFGHATPSNIDLAALGTRGFRIDGAAAGEFSADVVAGIGDTNGDGRPDFAISATGAANNGRTDSGSTYVIFGRAAPGNLDLAALGNRGYRIDGAATNDNSGSPVAGIGDMNGDGRTDLATSAQGADHNGRVDSGAVYVMFGFGTPSVSYPSITTTVGLALPPTVPSNVERTGIPAFAATGLPIGLIVDPATGAIRGTPTRSGTRRSAVTMTDLAGTATTSLTIRVLRCVTARVGNNRRNVIRGDKRSDTITGKGGNDLLLGGPNEDCISGGPGDDTISGGPAFDTLRGGPGADVILGGSGDDDIRSGPGRDTITAGKGNDTITARDDAPDAINCGKGKDTAIVDGSDTLRNCEIVRLR
jgi:hypothetical protein